MPPLTDGATDSLALVGFVYLAYVLTMVLLKRFLGDP